MDAMKNMLQTQQIIITSGRHVPYQHVRNTAPDTGRGRTRSNDRQRGPCSHGYYTPFLFLSRVSIVSSPDNQGKNGKGSAPRRSFSAVQHCQGANRPTLSFPSTILENQQDLTWLTALAERNGYSYRKSLSGAGPWIICPDNETIILERGLNDELSLRIWPMLQG
jgi:hypothetical protein